MEPSALRIVAAFGVPVWRLIRACRGRLDREQFGPKLRVVAECPGSSCFAPCGLCVMARMSSNDY